MPSEATLNQVPVNPDSPDETTFGQLRAPISIVKSDSHAGLSSRILTDPTGERRNWQLCQHFRGLRSCRPNPSGEYGVKIDGVSQEVAVPELGFKPEGV